MVRIVKSDTPQRFGLTCSELGNLTAPFFLFIFRNVATHETKSVVLEDLSTFKERFNLFELPGGFFTSGGWFIYIVYEQNSSDNLDPVNAHEVERGRLYVDAGNTNILKEYSANETKYTEYNG